MLIQLLKENESVQRLIKDGRGSALITLKGGIDVLQKTTLTTSNVTTGGVALTATGVLPIDRTPTIMAAARRRLFIRDLLTVSRMDEAVADYAGVETDVLEASPQTEASDKYENALKLVSRSAPARTIATYLPASKQIMRDLPSLDGFVRGAVTYSLLRKEQDQIILGNNTGQQLNGMVNQAQAFDTSLLVGADGWEFADLIGRAAQQSEEDEESAPTFVVLHPTRYWNIRLQKNSNGDYIYGPVTEGENFRLFGLQVLRTKAVSINQFLVGTTDADAVELKEREELNIEISTSHSDYFSKGLLAVRAEERVALLVYKGASFVTGSFTQSPA